MNSTPEPVIEVSHVKMFIGGAWVHQDINLTVYRGEVLGIVGGSGCGKSLLLREILALQRPTAGEISLFGKSLQKLSPERLDRLHRRLGVLFQQNALFSSLTVLENVCFPLKEYTRLEPKLITELAMLKILAVGLSPDTAYKYPSELSGGMEKRAALARAIALDPELLFLDEPTAGLDPHAASALDELILNLQSSLGLTIVIVTHDLDSLWETTDRVAFLGNGKVLCVGTMTELVKSENPLIRDYFDGPRGRVITQIYDKET